ncbi:MAG: hypothetical protein KAT11_00360 [Phycisphaerae bacterium]|nr:hypothetical protein [Phycisphaerae bacterium]
MRKNRLTIVATMLLLFCSNVVFGFDPMGPPKAMLAKGQPSFGLEYLYSKMQIEMGGPTFGPIELSEVDIEDVEINKIYANFGYGFTDRWEVFARLGVAALDIDQGENIDNFTALIGNSDDLSLAIGAGTRATFFEWENISVGMLAQISFVPFENFNGNSGSQIGGVPATLDTEIHMTEVQIALGPTWNCTEYLSIYGGPFLHLIDGVADLTAIFDGFSLADSVGIEQSAIFGGYIGASVRLFESPNINCNVEFQATGHGYALAIQLAISP